MPNMGIPSKNYIKCAIYTFNMWLSKKGKRGNQPCFPPIEYFTIHLFNKFNFASLCSPSSPTTTLDLSIISQSIWIWISTILFFLVPLATIKIELNLKSLNLSQISQLKYGYQLILAFITLSTIIGVELETQFFLSSRLLFESTRFRVYLLWDGRHWMSMGVKSNVNVSGGMEGIGEWVNEKTDS